MFFPERIKGIRKGDRVLEIGPGAYPHPRSDVLLEKRFGTETEASAQRGYAPAAKTRQETVHYDGGRFPFDDRSFDYVICSHVLEHVPPGDLPLFLAELQRVAPRGFIEFPNVFYELINYQDVHLWLMNYREGRILFMDKKRFESGWIHKIYREMFYGSDRYMAAGFARFKELFFSAFEWEGTIRHTMVDGFDDLVNALDYNRYKLYFSSLDVPRPDVSPASRIARTVQKGRAYLKWGFKMVRRGYFVHPTAVLEDRKLIRIKRRAEINDHVIIRTFVNPVLVGEYSQINPFTVIYGGSGVFIGDNVMIAPHCMIAAGDHDYKQTDKPIRFAGSITKGPIVIEDNVWIGANCTITDGVRIGRDSVVAANSVVTRDVAPFDIVGGVPAKVIGNRKALA